MYKRGNAKLGRRVDDRPAHVAARPHDDIRLELLQHLLGFPDTLEKPHDGLHIVQGQTSAESGDVDRAERKIFLGDQLALQPSCSADI
ncbi:hypothetical protein D3C72_2029710 [compost metagenome]